MEMNWHKFQHHFSKVAGVASADSDSSASHHEDVWGLSFGHMAIGPQAGNWTGVQQGKVTANTWLMPPLLGFGMSFGKCTVAEPNPY